jgi:hypothetical protein
VATQKKKIAELEHELAKAELEKQLEYLRGKIDGYKEADRRRNDYVPYIPWTPTYPGWYITTSGTSITSGSNTITNWSTAPGFVLKAEAES